MQVDGGRSRREEIDAKRSDSGVDESSGRLRFERPAKAEMWTLIIARVAMVVVVVVVVVVVRWL